MGNDDTITFDLAILLLSRYGHKKYCSRIASPEISHSRQDVPGHVKKLIPGNSTFSPLPSNPEVENERLTVWDAVTVVKEISISHSPQNYSSHHSIL